MRETVNKLKEALVPIYGKGESDAIIRLIFHYVKGWSLTDMLIHSDDELSPFIKEEIDGILKRLLNHEPIQYITGEARFHGMDFIIKPGVLIPRPETDELTDIVIEENKNREDLKVLDLCTGSGCIAITLARNLRFAKVDGVDFSDIAFETAKENSEKLKTKIGLIKADIFSWEPTDKYDIIISNPPYIMDREALTMDKNVLDYEPHDALFVRDEDPLIFYKRISEIGKNFLKEGGKLYLEINPLTAGLLKNLMINQGYNDVKILRDSSGKERFLSC